MNGRQEADTKIEQKNIKKLKDQPQIVTEYYYSDLRKTAQTKRVYLNHVCAFLDFLKNTYHLNVNDVEALKKIKGAYVNQFLISTQKRITSYGTEVNNSSSSQAVKFFAISNFMNFLSENGYINNNPCDKLSAPSVNMDKDVVALTAQEIKHIKDNIINGVGTENEKKRRAKWRTRDLAIIELGISTGLRVGAIVSINVSDIDFQSRSFTVVEKGNKTRTVYFSKNVEKTLQTWMRDRENILDGTQCDALFISQLKERMNENTVNRMIQLYTYDLGKKITPHKMRSTCATNLYEQTSDVYLVADVLGHKNLSNTRRYTKQSENRRRQAADIMSDFMNSAENNEE